MVWLAAVAAIVVLVPGVADRFRSRRMTTAGDATGAMAVLIFAAVVTGQIEPVSSLLIGHGRDCDSRRRGFGRT